MCCKWEHLKETIFKEKILFNIAKEETRLKRFIRSYWTLDIMTCFYVISHDVLSSLDFGITLDSY